MRSLNQAAGIRVWRAAGGMAAFWAACLVVGAASAQSVVTQPTTATLWAGTQDYNVFGLADITSPESGVILEGTAISAITGKPVRH